MKKDLNSVLIRPRVTEKSTFSAEKGVYVFEISPRSSKKEVEKAFVEKYKKNPVKISTVTIPAKKVFVRGKVGSKSGYKKAYIYLNKGDKIENL